MKKGGRRHASCGVVEEGSRRAESLRLRKGYHTGAWTDRRRSGTVLDGGSVACVGQVPREV